MGACSVKPDLSPILYEAESLTMEQPDSSLSLLKEIQFPEKASDEQYALWCLLYTQAMDKAGIEHTSDSLIQKAVEYFEKTSQSTRKMQAYYYCGVVYYDLNDAPQAQSYFLKAYEVGKNLNEYSLLGRLCANLGVLYTYQELYAPALDFEKKAIEYFKEEVDSVSLSLTLRNIARIYVCDNLLDSAICYYSKALRYTSGSHEFYIQNELADTYGRIGDYQNGLFYAKKAYTQIRTTNDSCLISLTMGNLFFKMGENDSAYAYLSFCEKSSNGQTLAGGYSSLAQLEKLRGELNKYVFFQEKYETLKDSIDKETYTEMLYRLQSMYDYRLVEKEKEFYRQKVDKKTRSIYWISLIGILLLTSVICVFAHNNNKKRKKEQQLNQSLRLQEQKYRESQQYLRDREVSVDRLKKQLIVELQNRECVENDLQSKLGLVQRDKIELAKRLDLVLDMIDKKNIRHTKKQNDDIEKAKVLFFTSDLYHGIYSEWTKMDKTKWPDLVDWIDQLLYVDFTHRVKDLYPGISDFELQICYLIKLSIPVGRIALLLCSSSQAVSVCKKRLYTKLTGKQGSAKDFDNYIVKF